MEHIGINNHVLLQKTDEWLLVEICPIHFSRISVLKSRSYANDLKRPIRNNDTRADLGSLQFKRDQTLFANYFVFFLFLVLFFITNVRKDRTTPRKRSVRRSFRVQTATNTARKTENKNRKSETREQTKNRRPTDVGVTVDRPSTAD